MPNDIYIITPTDGNLSREFNVSPYSSNGTVSPISDVLDPSAVAVNTSLLFQGKGSDAYGERLQENFYHLLENFSSYTEPRQPIQGQLWFDNSDNTLKIFEATALDVFDVDGSSLIIRLNGNPDSKYFQLVKDAIKLRFSAGFKFNIFSVSTHDVLDTYIASSMVDTPATYTVPGGQDLRHFLSLTLNTFSNILLPSTPSITPIRSQIGLWIPVFNTSTDILDAQNGNVTSANVYGMLEHLNIADNRIINLADPIDPTDGVNNRYLSGNFLQLTGGTLTGNLIVGGTLTVQGATTLNDNLNIVGSNILLDNTSRITGLVDPSPSNPLDAMNLQYADANYVKVSGDSMTGVLTLNSQPGQNSTPGTSLIVHAATVGYVNDTITALGSGPTELTDLLDVNISTPASLEMLQYNGTQWINVVNPAANFNPADFISTTIGGTVGAAGILTLNGQPGQNGNAGSTLSAQSATVGYVNSTVNDQFQAELPNGDIYVVSGTYNSISDVLALQRSGLQPDVLINGIASSITSTATDSTLVPHTIAPEQQDLGDVLEAQVASIMNWPTINVSLALGYLAKSLREGQKRHGSAVFTSDGRAGIYDLDAFSNEVFTAGYNSLQVYINGLKQIASTRGYIEGFRTTLMPNVYPGVATGLANDPTVYTFNINVNGGGNQLISVTGANAQRYALLKDEINSQINNARCAIYDGGIIFVSDISGSGSSISISDVTLFSSLSGTLVFDGPVTGVDHDYVEIGEYGFNDNTQMQFTSTVPTGSTLEFVIIQSGGNTDNFGYEL